jgi:hypothetical protein
MSDITLVVSAPGPTVELTADAPGAVTVTVNEGGGVSTHAELSDLATSGHPASVIAFTPTGSIAATTVQAAVAEVATDAAAAYQPLDSDLTAIAALTTPATTISGAAQKASNLSDLASASSARTNLGLGGAALLAVGTTAGTVAAGDDSRITAKALNGPGLVSGWYAGGAGVIDTVSMAANVAMYTAFPVERAVTVDRIGLNISAGVSGSTVRLGIYGDTGGLPGTLLVDAGTINSASTGYMEISISTALTVGRVWLCAVMQGGASPVTAVAVRFPFAGPAPTSGYSGTSGGGLALTTGPSGALPSTASTPNDIRSTPPRVMLRVV